MNRLQSLKHWTTVVADTENAEASADCKAPAQACDISRGGLKLQLAHKFERGTILTIRAAYENVEKVPSMTAEVRYTVPTPKGNWIMGCAFLRDLSERELQAWISDEGMRN